MTIKPRPGYVLIREHEQSNETESGIIVATDDRDPSCRGEVVQVGAGTPFKVGQNVLFYNHAFEPIDGLLIGKEEGIYATYAD